MKFWTNHKGTLLVAFRGNNRLRTLLTATNYGAAGMAGKKISMIESAFRTTGSNAKESKNNQPRISLVCEQYNLDNDNLNKFPNYEIRS